MALTPGTRLGHYDVTALLGEGGMGQVWQATDTQLNREVALKILPDAFAADPDRLARFTREAQILASLNHPNIAAIHGIEEAEGTRALVLELVEGPTLADRIAKGPIPLDEALPIAKQIAEALEAAHEAGVIHRDLKPANIKVREDGTVKVLDFGLAKALAVPGLNLTDASTVTAIETREGVILGTAAYMSPEQARGKSLDKRTDIWAFGAVLYEMLTGRAAFAGDTLSDTIANVLGRDPRWETLPADTPPDVTKLLRRCLDKAPRDRLRDIGDAHVELREVTPAPVNEHPGAILAPIQPAAWRRVVPWVAGIAVGSIMAGGVVWTFMRPSVPVTTRFTLVLPPGVRPSGLFRVELSPDGGTLAFGGSSAGVNQVYLRPLDQLDAFPVQGTEGTGPVAFSPDGRELLVRGNTAVSALLRVPVGGGRPIPIVDNRRMGASRVEWGPDDTLVLPGIGLGLCQSDGEEASLTTLADGELWHTDPTSLPNGRGVLFSIENADGPELVAVVDRETGERTTLLQGRKPRFAASGHLVFWRDEALWTIAFDPDRLEMRGEPVMVEAGRAGAGVRAAYTIADNGTLVYQPAASRDELVWVDRAGEVTASRANGMGPRISPNGARVAVNRNSVVGGWNVWVIELESGRETKLTEHSATDFFPVWTADGTDITFTSSRTGSQQLYSRPADLSGQTERLSAIETVGVIVAGARSPDGTLLYHAAPAEDTRDIWRVPPGGTPVPVVVTPNNERAPRLSPNGRWLAYVSDQSDEDRVYVQAFPDGGPVIAVSSGPGTEAVWSRDGRELFYRNGPEMWVVEVETEPAFRPGTARLLFEGDYLPGVSGMPNYDVSLDGQQFLMVRPPAAASTDGYVVVQSWFEELKRLVPVP